MQMSQAECAAFPEYDYTTGLSMLVPLPWEPGWTALREVFNSRRPEDAKAQDPYAYDNCNAVTVSTAPISAATSAVKAVLGANARRRLLIVQNNSSATAAGDVAPNFFVAFAQQANANAGLTLQPGVGIVLDYACPVDAVYVTIGPFSNGGGTVVIAGAALEGTKPGGG